MSELQKPTRPNPGPQTMPENRKGPFGKAHLDRPWRGIGSYLSTAIKHVPTLSLLVSFLTCAVTPQEETNGTLQGATGLGTCLKIYTNTSPSTLSVLDYCRTIVTFAFSTISIKQDGALDITSAPSLDNTCLLCSLPDLHQLLHYNHLFLFNLLSNFIHVTVRYS